MVNIDKRPKNGFNKECGRGDEELDVKVKYEKTIRTGRTFGC